MERARIVIGEWQVNMREGLLCKDGVEHHLSPRVMAVLAVLVANAGEVVLRRELLDDVWHGMIVCDDVLTQCISELRATLGDNRAAPRYIKTIPKRGYVLIARVQPIEKESSARVIPRSSFAQLLEWMARVVAKRYS